ncbi:DUF1932 domain-containing protein [Sphingomonas qilianensis]|uniref:DUF1932 domain-containing protein n=1 Tax=Sphingomonas qilianensis TaxID=1736690 RepID=A0ABU9XUU2_9SPHN
MESNVTFIGFGEAAMAFAGAGARGYDIKLDATATRTAKLADFRATSVTAHESPAAALDGATIVLSLVTADQALAAARSSAPLLRPDALYLDLNSVAPDTKRTASAALGDGARYVDVAVMAPVDPARRGVPLLVSGPHAAAGAAALDRLGFSNVTIVGTAIGDASAIKMIRSVMVKGLEALTAECVLAADAAGVREAVIASLDASWPGADWARRFDYNLDRMMVHGLRRSEEMHEVAQTLTGLGIAPLMTDAAMQWQYGVGERRIPAPPGLDAKLTALRPLNKSEAA